MAPRVLTDDEIEQHLTELPGWTGDAERLHRTAVAPDFRSAITLVNRIADIAEAMNHHPDIDIRWRRVHFTLRTHVSNGVTGYDVELAQRIEEAIRDLGAT